MDAREKDKNAFLRKWLSAGLLLVSCLLVVFLSFISLDLALIAGVIVTLAAFFDVTQGKTKNLEQFLQNTVYDISERQNMLEKDVRRNSEDIRKMEHELAQTKVTVKANTALHSSKIMQSEHKAFSFNEIIPAFLKPQGWGKNPQAMIEEEDEEDVFISNTSERTPPVVENESFVANDEIFLDDQSLSDMVVRELVHHAVRNNRIDVFMQPILRLPQRQVKFYEMFARIRAKPGVYLPANRYMNLATEENVMTAIDNMLLLHGLQTLRKNKELQRVSSFFLNVKPETLKDVTFMRDLLDFLAKNRDMASSLIFEMRQDDFYNLSKGEQKILEGLAQLGCSLSLDNVTTIPEDIKFLQDKKVRFIKIGAEKLLEAAKTDRDYTTMIRLKRRLEANGIGVIIEKIESETDLLELLDFNINYGQGYLFGRPDLQGVYARQRAS